MFTHILRFYIITDKKSAYWLFSHYVCARRYLLGFVGYKQCNELRNIVILCQYFQVSDCVLEAVDAKEFVLQD